MRDLAQELRRVTFFLERIRIVRGADDFYFLRDHFPTLAFPLGRDQRAAHRNGRSRDQMLDRVIVRQRVLRDDLKILEAGAVVQLNEREILRIPPGSHPAAHLNRRSGRSALQSILD